MSKTDMHRRGITKLTILIVLVIGLSCAGWKLSTQLAAAALGAPQGSYLDLKEAGVHISLNDSIQDAVYAPFEVAPTDGSQVYGISAQSLVDQGTSTYCSAASGALGLIIVTTSPTVITGAHTTSQLIPDGKTIFKQGSTYIRYLPPQNYGCAVGQITTVMVGSKQAAFAQAFATLQPDNQ